MHRILCRTLRRFLFAVFFLAPLLAGANGWEHTAIPVSTLFDALRNKSPELRQQAAHSLGHHRGERVVRELIALIDNGEPIPAIRQAVFVSLGKIGDPLALTAIETCLKSEPTESVRIACAASLSGIVTPEAQALTLKRIPDNHPVVQRALLTSLGNYAGARSLAVLTESLQSKDSLQRRAAITALGKTGHPDALKALLPLITDGADESDLIAVLKASARIGGTDTPPAIQRVYETNGSDRIRRFALIALASFGNDVQGLFEALDSEDPLLQIQALEILRETNDKNDVDRVIRSADKRAAAFFNRSKESVEAQPDQALIELSVLNEFLRTIIAIDPHHADALFNTVAQPFDVARNKPALLQVAEGLYRARWQAIYGLGYTHKGAADTVLNQAIDDPDARIRAVALRSMGVNDPAKFRQAAIAALNDDSAEVRWQAAMVLGRDKSGNDVSPLIKAATDSYAKVRKEVALSLGYLGNSQAKSVLEKMASDDEDVQVRAAAAYALELLE